MLRHHLLASMDADCVTDAELSMLFPEDVPELRPGSGNRTVHTSEPSGSLG